MHIHYNIRIFVFMKISAKYKKKSGIYCIMNTINSKKYIGSSINIQYRLQKHRSLLRGNYHTNNYLQNSWNKYGEKNFICYVLEYVVENELLKREQYYVSLFGEYNLTKEIERNNLSKESRLKQSETRKKMFQLNLLPKTTKAITQYSLKGIKIKDWNSITEASKVLNIHPTTIIRNLQGVFKQGKGFLWTYKDQKSPKPYERTIKEVFVNKRSKKILFKSDDEVLEFDSWKLATIYFKVSFPNMYQYYRKQMKFKKKYMIDLIKLDKLLETPTILEDNQQPTINLND